MSADLIARARAAAKADRVSFGFPRSDLVDELARALELAERELEQGTRHISRLHRGKERVLRDFDLLRAVVAP